VDNVRLKSTSVLIVGSFMLRMTEHLKSSESHTIFTDDLRSAICLAESNDDVDVTVQMARRSVVHLHVFV